MALKVLDSILLVTFYFYSVGCSCLYQYDIQPKSSFNCNPSLCNCSLELVCSATVATIVAANSNIAIKWYFMDSLSMDAHLVTSYKMLDLRSNNELTSHLVLQDVKSEAQYWCELEDPDYLGSIAISNVIHLLMDNSSASCMLEVDYSTLNQTCAGHTQDADDYFAASSEPIIITCMGTLACVLLFLLAAVIYGKVNNSKDKIIKNSYHSESSYDIYSEPTEIAQDLEEQSAIIKPISSHHNSYVV